MRVQSGVRCEGGGRGRPLRAYCPTCCANCCCCCVHCPACACPAYAPVQTVKEEISVLAELALCVREEEAPELYRLSEEDSVEVGPFTVSSATSVWEGLDDQSRVESS